MYTKDFNLWEDEKDIKLSVIMMTDSFFYSISSNEFGILCHKSFENIQYSKKESIANIFGDVNLKLDFISIDICCISNHNIITKTDNTDVIMTVPTLESKDVFVEKFSSIDSLNYFGISPHQSNMLNDLFVKDNCIFHSPLGLLSEWYDQNVEDVLHIHFEQSIIFIFAQRANEIIFFNTFQVSEVNDILYFCLHISNNVSFHPNQISCFVSGWVEEKSKLFTVLSGYFGKLQITSGATLSSKIDKDSDLEPHYYFLHFLNVR